MSDKPWKKLNPIDRQIRQESPVGMEEGTKLVIRRTCGFEMFNTRPYHNYETWSDGYTVIGRIDGKAMSGIEVEAVLFNQVSHRDVYCWHSAEDLDDAIAGFHRARDKLRAAAPVTP